jgi:hypothetical protein
MKDCDSKRSWIGGEGLPSRDLGQRKRENNRTIEGSVIMEQCSVFWYRSQNNTSFNVQSCNSTETMGINVTIMLLSYRIVQQVWQQINPVRF